MKMNVLSIDLERIVQKFAPVLTGHHVTKRQENVSVEKVTVVKSVKFLIVQRESLEKNVTKFVNVIHIILYIAILGMALVIVGL